MAEDETRSVHVRQDGGDTNIFELPQTSSTKTQQLSEIIFKRFHLSFARTCYLSP